ncbi:MAG: hypothetical protein ACLUOB_12740 [Subdoligranulum sp.]
MAGESPATPQSGTRRPFDVAPYLEQEEAARRNAAQTNPADQAAAAAQAGQPAAQPQQAYTRAWHCNIPRYAACPGCAPRRAAHPKLCPARPAFGL